MYLNATTDKLEIVLSSPVTSKKLDWNVSWQDINASGMVLPQSAGAGGTNNTTAVTMVAAPAASTTRQVTNINIYNADIVTASVIIQKDVSGVKFILAIYDLSSGNTLSWSRENGWQDISGSGSTAIKILNGLGDISQSFDTGTAGSDFNIVSSAGVHTFNFPDADSLNRGLLTPLDWSTFNGKQNALTIGNLTEVTSSVLTITGGTGSIIGSGLTIQVKQASGSQSGFLSSTDWSTFNNKQGALTLTTTGSSGAATLVGNTLNIPNYTGGGVTTVGTIDSVTKSAEGAVVSGSSIFMQTADATNPGLISTGTQTIAGAKTLTARLTINQDTTVTTEVCAVIAAGTTNANLVIAPNGTGALIADIPDGTAAGGNARGDNAVDLQMQRRAATHVASGAYSFIGGGQTNTASGLSSVVCGGGINSTSSNNIASGNYSSILGGERNRASGLYSSVVGGFAATASLYGQLAIGSGPIGATSGSRNAQTSNIRLYREITGTAITELFLNGSSERAVIDISEIGSTNARAWRAQIDVVAICATAGGTTVLNDVFAGSYHAAIKRVGTTTSLVGTVSVTNEVSDASMSTSVVTIDADDTNESLKIEFTPPTTAVATTVIRVVATAYLTEVGR
jgi:hypothetical protein